MGLDLASVSRKTAVTQVNIFGELVTVTYDPNSITMKSLRTADSDGGFVPYFAKVVKDWDVTRAKRKVPLTTAALEEVPSSILRAILKAIMEDVGDGSAGKASSAG